MDDDGEYQYREIDEDEFYYYFASPLNVFDEYMMKEELMSNVTEAVEQATTFLT